MEDDGMGTETGKGAAAQREQMQGDLAVAAYWGARATDVYMRAGKEGLETEDIIVRQFIVDGGYNGEEARNLARRVNEAEREPGFRGRPHTDAVREALLRYETGSGIFNIGPDAEKYRSVLENAGRFAEGMRLKSGAFMIKASHPDTADHIADLLRNYPAEPSGYGYGGWTTQALVGGQRPAEPPERREIMTPSRRVGKTRTGA